MRKQRNLGVLSVISFVSVLLLAACQSNVGLATKVEGCGNPDKGTTTKIGGVTDVGQLEDKSFNEAGWCGTIAGADATDSTARVIVTKDPADYATNMQTFIDNGYKIIVTFGFALGNATAIAAKANPNVKFIGLDQFICIKPDGTPDTRTPAKCDGNPAKLLPNYQGIVFVEAEAGYLAGIVAGSITKSNVIGTVGGINTIPPVVNYIAGYVNGAKFVNPSVQVLVQYASTDITKAFNDSAKGKSIAQQMIAQKADVIFQVAGLTGQGAVEAACDANIYAIGVDVDQFFSLPSTLQKCIVTSAEKKIKIAIESAIERIDKGTDNGGNIINDAKSDPVGIGLAPYHDLAGLITVDIQAKIDAALTGLKDGSLDPCKGEGKCFGAK